MIRFKGKVSFVEKNGKQYARASYAKDGKRHQVWRVVEQRKSDAKDAVVAEIERILNDTGEQAEKTFHDLAVYYEKTKAQPARFEHDQKVSGTKTYRQLRHIIRQLAVYLGNTLLSSITRDDCDRYRLYLLDKPVRHIKGGKAVYETRSLASVNQHLRVLRAMLNKAEQNGWIARKVNFSGLIAHAAEAKRETIPTEYEFERILKACDTRQRLNHVKAIALLIADTGARPVELWQLKHADLNLDEEWVIYTSDKGVMRTRQKIFLTDRCLAALRELPRLNEYVFGGIKSIKRAWKSIQQIAGVTFTPYHLRHLYGTRLDILLHSQVAKQKAMRHSTDRMFQRYAKVDDARMMAIRDALNANPYLPVIDSEVVQ
jgi:integrase